MGQRVYYFIEEVGNEKWHSARVLGWSNPGEGGHPRESQVVRYRLLPDKEKGQTYLVVERTEDEIRNWSWTRQCLAAKASSSSNSRSKPSPLLPLDRVGIDTCSALSVSSRREDFLWLDESRDAKRSVILRGVGGKSAMIGGRGPMVVQGLDDEGNEVAIFDPSGVYLSGSADQAEFRIFGQQRLKTFGFNLQQRSEDEGGDILLYQGGLKTIPLQTNGGILTLRTLNKRFSSDQRKFLESEIDGVLSGEDGKDYCLVLEQTSLLMNEANLTEIEAQRLNHWRIGHRSVAKSVLNEDCPVCTEGKKKVGTYKRNFEFQGNTKGPLQPYWRLYCDGYGGQQSLGDMSYQGGIGGYVFACP